jgi:hypothetical protein
MKAPQGMWESSRFHAGIDERTKTILSYPAHSLDFRCTKEIPYIHAIGLIFNLDKVVYYIAEDVVFSANGRSMDWRKFAEHAVTLL